MASRVASRAAVALALIAASVGCGDDASDEDSSDDDRNGDTARDGGSTKPDASKPPSSNVPQEFIVSCVQSRNKTCVEYLGDSADEAAVKERVDETCDQADEEVSEERCSSTDFVGSCRGQSEISDATFWVKTFYYAPLTESEVKTRCQGLTFEAAP